MRIEYITAEAVADSKDGKVSVRINPTPSQVSTYIKVFAGDIVKIQTMNGKYPVVVGVIGAGDRDYDAMCKIASIVKRLTTDKKEKAALKKIVDRADKNNVKLT